MSEFISGLDLAERKDYTAFAMLERCGAEGAWVYAVRQLVRFERGTPYATMIGRVARWYGKEPLAGSVLAVDQTGVGRPVVEMLYQQEVNASIYPITITAGQRARQEDNGDYHVPKKDLVASLVKLMESGRLPIVPELDNAGVLIKEMQTFTAKITTSGHEVYEAWRESDHDDLVLAVALAVWAGENLFVGKWDVTANPEAQIEMEPRHARET